jgi:hypothetical protein
MSSGITLTYLIPKQRKEELPANAVPSDFPEIFWMKDKLIEQIALLIRS